MHRPQFELGKTTIGQLVDTVAVQFADCKALEYPNRGVSYNYVVYALCPELYTAIPGNLETIEKGQCTALHGVPTMFIVELEEMNKKTYATS